MELLREKNYKSPDRERKLIICEDMREWNYPAQVYDYNCRHFSRDEYYHGQCELNIPMCNCGRDCYMTTTGHEIRYPTTKERG